MHTHTRRAALGAVLALSMLPGLASAGPHSSQVNDTFSRPVANGCTYYGSLAGSVQKRNHLSIPLVMDRDRYDAQMTVGGQISCPGSNPVTVQPRTVSIQNVRRGELEQRLEVVGRATVLHNGQECTVTPDFDVSRGRVVADSRFFQRCVTAPVPASIGGGPTPAGGTLHGVLRSW